VARVGRGPDEPDAAFSDAELATESAHEVLIIGSKSQLKRESNTTAPKFPVIEHQKLDQSQLQVKLNLKLN
jgi:hypothetical protein